MNRIKAAGILWYFANICLESKHRTYVTLPLSDILIRNTILFFVNMRGKESCIK